MKLVQIVLLSCLSIPSLQFVPIKFTFTGSKSVLCSSPPPYWGSASFDNDENQRDESGQNGGSGNDDGESLKANRWSKFAPDANLPAEQFRAQLKENMKADLERRRREDPNRGNQIAKNYLDSL